MLKSYLTPGLLALFLLGAVAWFVWKPSSDSSPQAVVEDANPHAGAPAVGGGGPLVSGRSPFLTTHEPSAAFTPDADNIAPSFHVALEALRRNLEKAPQDTTLLLRMARLMQDGHKTEEAAAYYRRYLALHPQGRQAWLDLAQCYGALERWDEALATTQDLLQRFPDDPAGLYNLGAVYANTGRIEEARAAWQRVVAQARNPEMKTMAQSALKRLTTLYP